MHRCTRPAVVLATLAALAGVASAEACVPDLRPQVIHADVTLPDGSHLRVDTVADDVRTFVAAGVVTVTSPDGRVDVATMTCTAALHGYVGTVTREPADVAADATGGTDAVFSALSPVTGMTYYGFLAVRTSKAGTRRPYAALSTRPDYARCRSPRSGRPVAGSVTITY